jgi:hypothetical protein
MSSSSASSHSSSQPPYSVPPLKLSSSFLSPPASALYSPVNSSVMFPSTSSLIYPTSSSALSSLPMFLPPPTLPPSIIHSKFTTTVSSNDIPVAFGLLDGLWVAVYNPEGNNVLSNEKEKEKEDGSSDNDKGTGDDSSKDKKFKLRKDVLNEQLNNRKSYGSTIGIWELIIRPIHADLSIVLNTKDTFVKSVQSTSPSPSSIFPPTRQLSPLPFTMVGIERKNAGGKNKVMGTPVSTSLCFNVHLSTNTVDISVKRSHLVLFRDASAVVIEFLKQQRKRVREICYLSLFFHIVCFVSFFSLFIRLRTFFAIIPLLLVALMHPISDAF